jgi:hypothetical protein
MASVRGILNIQSLNELTYENTRCVTYHILRGVLLLRLMYELRAYAADCTCMGMSRYL